MPEPLRVFVCVPWSQRLGGAEQMLWLAVTRGDRTRVRYSVACLEPGPFEHELRGSGVTTYAVPCGRLRDARATGRTIRALRTLIAAEQPDLVLNWHPKAQLYGAPAAAGARRGDRIVWWQHGVPESHWMDRLATALPSRAVGCSSGLAARAQGALRPHRRTFVVHPGVRTERVEPVGLGIPAGRRVIGIVGRLQPWKGQHRFLRALRRLLDDGHDVHGLIVGGTAHGFSAGFADELEALAGELGVRDRVTMTGQVDDARPYIGAMDVMVSASDVEPFGIVVLEAMAQGVPVVATASGGPLEIIDPEVDGLLVDRPEPAPLAAAVARLLGDAPLRARIAAAGRRLAVERFDAAAMTRALEDELHALTAEAH
ncbi:MAG: glycosyltransferase family 4 protein [Solirubrobacterales bacterium]|nr:glycosyltransferase family 4 protein [Solirubrobacterales bacterium]